MTEWIRWTPDLAVHVDRIDDQHKELYRRMNGLIEAVMAGKGKEEIGKFADFLVDYTNFHFREEETVMQAKNYPGYGAQRSAHDYFRAEAAKSADKVRRGEVTSELVVKIVEDLRDWFSGHIRRMDVELGKFLQSK
jgi:hemerythrin